MVAGFKNGTTARPRSASTVEATKTSTGSADKKPRLSVDTSSPSVLGRGVGPKPGSRCAECCRANSAKWYRHKTRNGEYTCEGCHRFFKTNRHYRVKPVSEEEPRDIGTRIVTGSGSTVKGSKHSAAAAAKRSGPTSRKPIAAAGEPNAPGPAAIAEKRAAAVSGAKRKMLSEQDAVPRQKRAKQENEHKEQEPAVDKASPVLGQPGKLKMESQASKPKAEGHADRPRKAAAKRVSHDGAPRISPQRISHDSPQTSPEGVGDVITGGNYGAELTSKPERPAADALTDVYPRRRAAAVAAARGIAECSARGSRAPKGGGNTATGGGMSHAAAPGGAAAVAGSTVNAKPQVGEVTGWSGKAFGGESTSGASKTQSGAANLVGAAAASMARRTALLKAVGELKCVICGNKESRRWCKHRQKQEGVTCERCDDYFRRHGVYTKVSKKRGPGRQSGALAAEPEARVDDGPSVHEQAIEPGAVSKRNVGGKAGVAGKARKETVQPKEEPAEAKAVIDAAPSPEAGAGTAEATSEAGKRELTAAGKRGTENVEGDQEKEQVEEKGAITPEVAGKAAVAQEMVTAGREDGPEVLEAPEAGAPRYVEVPGAKSAAAETADPMEMDTKAASEPGMEAPGTAASLTVKEEVDWEPAAAAKEVGMKEVSAIAEALLPAPATSVVLAALDLQQANPVQKEPIGGHEPVGPAVEMADLATRAALREGGPAPPSTGAAQPVAEGQAGDITASATATAGATYPPLATEVTAAERAEGRPEEGPEGVPVGGGANRRVSTEGPREESAGGVEAPVLVAVGMEIDEAAPGAVDGNKAVTGTKAYLEDGPTAPKLEAGAAAADLQPACGDCTGAGPKAEAYGPGDVTRPETVTAETAVEQPPAKRAGLRRHQPQPKQQRASQQERNPLGEMEKETEEKLGSGRDNDRQKAAGGLGKSGEAAARPGPQANPGAGGGTAPEARSCAACGSFRTQSGWRRHQGGEVGKVVCKRCYDWHYRHGTYERGTPSLRVATAAAAAAPAAPAGGSSGTSTMLAALRRPRKVSGAAAASGAQPLAATEAGGKAPSAATPSLGAAQPSSETAAVSDAMRTSAPAADAERRSTAAEDDALEPPSKRQKLTKTGDMRRIGIGSGSGSVTGSASTATPMGQIKTLAMGRRALGTAEARKDACPAVNDRSARERPPEPHVGNPGAAFSQPKMVADTVVLQSYLQAFCDALARACKALVELEDQYGIRLLDTPAPPPLSALASGGCAVDGNAAGACLGPAGPGRLLPSARSSLRLFYERVCGSDAHLRSRHLADVLIRWLELNAWRYPVALLLGPAAGNLSLDREIRFDLPQGDQQGLGKPHAAAPAQQHSPPSISPAALEFFRQVVESLALNMAQNLLGLLPPKPRQRQPASAGGEGDDVPGGPCTAVPAADAPGSAPSKVTPAASTAMGHPQGKASPGAHAALMSHLESLAAAALHLAHRVAAAPGHLALRLAAPGDPIVLYTGSSMRRATTTTSTTTMTTLPVTPHGKVQAPNPSRDRHQPVPAPGLAAASPLPAAAAVTLAGGSSAAVAAVEWVRCGAVAGGTGTRTGTGTGGRSREDVEVGRTDRHLRLANLLRSVYAGDVVQWQDSNVSLSLDRGGPAAARAAAEMRLSSANRSATGASSSPPPVLWMVSPGIVSREFRTENLETMGPAVANTGSSPSPFVTLAAQPNKADAPPASSAVVSAIPPPSPPWVPELSDQQGPVEVAAAAEAAGAVCVAVAKALARGDHDELLGATMAAADVVIKLVRTMSKNGFDAKAEPVDVPGGDLSKKATVSATALLEEGLGGKGAAAALGRLPPGPAQVQVHVQQPLVVDVEVPIIPAMVIGCKPGP